MLRLSALAVLLIVSAAQLALAAPVSVSSLGSDWRHEHRFEAVDHDGDGFVSAAEFEHRMAENMLAFEPSDSDDDGRLNRAEYDIALAYAARLSPAIY